MYFDHHLCFFQMKASSKQELFTIMSDRLYSEGFVKESYLEGISTREEEYPTAISVNGIGFAIPHTDSAHVNKSQICFASLQTPIEFFSMTDKSEKVPVKLVFMLAMSQPHEHAETLQNMISLFQNEEAANKLLSCTSVDEFTAILNDAKVY